ncbi:MAG: glycosyltransferase family 2 protein [Lachnospiraceae bacterium]|nr:glycosyltransferase family 2 protein [Lachnospiraceae bacterium]
MAKTALIILNYNDADTTEKLIRLVKDYSALDHIVVVDNCSIDDSFERLKVYASDKIDVLQAEANKGYATGNNFGAFYALEKYQPDYLLIANPDVEFSESVVVKLVETLAASEKAAVAAPIVNQGYNVWSLPTYWGIIEALFLVWFNLDKRSQKKKLIAKGGVQPVGVVEGSFFCVKAEVFEQIGGLDERTFLYCEENILAKRVDNIGMQVLALADERYDHFHSQSIKKHYRSKAKAFHNFYPSFELYLKEYLHIGPAAHGFYKFCFKLAYLERVFYDVVVKAKSKLAR